MAQFRLQGYNLETVQRKGISFAQEIRVHVCYDVYSSISSSVVLGNILVLYCVFNGKRKVKYSNIKCMDV